MKLSKTIIVDIDLNKERERIDSTFIEMNKMGNEVELPLYNKRERKFLHQLVDLFEVGEFESIKKLLNSSPEDYYEYINTQMEEVIRDILYWGSVYTVVEDEPNE